MSLSISGSNTSLAAQLLKSRRDAADATPSGSTAGNTSAAATATIDGSGAVPSSAMLSFLAQLSSSTSLGNGDASSGTAGGVSASDSATSSATRPHGSHRHGGGHAAGAASALTDAGAAGTSGSTASTSDTSEASDLVTAFQKAMQGLTVSGGTAGEASLSAGAAGTATGIGTSATAPVSADSLMRAILQAQQAYASQDAAGAED